MFLVCCCMPPETKKELNADYGYNYNLNLFQVYAFQVYLRNRKRKNERKRKEKKRKDPVFKVKAERCDKKDALGWMCRVGGGC